MVRDQEIQRLVNYIKGLGLKVTFSSKKSDGAAFWYIDNTEIVILTKNNESKIDTVLSLIHEIAHAKHNIYEKNREVDTKLEDALDHIDEAEQSETDTQKKQRKVILNHEIAGTRYWHEIYKETEMSFPIWKLDAAMEYDVYQYQFFYENGQYPPYIERRKRRKEINKKHRSKNGH